VLGWRDAMGEALYGSDGFFRHPDLGPADHFRTSAHTGRLFASAIIRLIERVDAALEHPARLDVIDIGAGRGELITALLDTAPTGLRNRVRPVAVEIGPHPNGLDDAVVWLDEPPAHITGIVLATEWLDNVPLDLVDMTGNGWRLVNVDSTGVTSIGDRPALGDAAWLDRWWPEGLRGEIGSTRDAAWSDAVARIDAGLALAVDYGHTRADRPALGTLTGFRHGREVLPVPDGSCDLTAHVAVDAVAAAGSAVANLDAHVVRQAEALRALGVTGRRPGLDLAYSDPLAYVRALADASTAAELTDPAGLGDHFWICQPVRLDAATLGLPVCAK
jgi:SAM-dependent MidA family methyltransferase